MQGTRPCHILVKFEFSREIFDKYSNIKFRDNFFSGILVVLCGRTDRHMTKLVVATRNIGNVPKSCFPKQHPSCS